MSVSFNRFRLSQRESRDGGQKLFKKVKKKITESSPQLLWITLFITLSIDIFHSVFAV
jgi:hypothetical protein